MSACTSKNCTLNWHSIDILYSLYFIRDNLPSYNPSVRMHAIFHSLRERETRLLLLLLLLRTIARKYQYWPASLPPPSAREREEENNLHANVTLRHLWPWVTSAGEKRERERDRERHFIYFHSSDSIAHPHGEECCLPFPLCSNYFFPSYVWRRQFMAFSFRSQDRKRKSSASKQLSNVAHNSHRSEMKETHRDRQSKRDTHISF